MVTDTKIKKRIQLGIVICISLLIALIIIVSSINHSYQRETQSINSFYVEGIRNSSRSDNTLTFNDIALNNTLNESNRISAFRQEKGVIENMHGKRVWNIRQIFSNSGYADFVPLDMIRGTFFDEKSVLMGSSIVIISDILANTLFKTVDVIGNKVQINDKIYRITGVYREPPSLIRILAGDDSHKVYIPYSSVLGGSEMTAENLFIMGSPDYNDDENVFFAEQYMRKTFGSDKNGYDIISNMNRHKAIRQFPQIMLYFYMILITLIALRYFIRESYRLLVKVKNETKNSYFIKSILKTVKNIGFGFPAASIAVIACVLILVKIDLNLYVPRRLIPAENLFELKAYIEIMKKEFVQNNLNQITDFNTNLYLLYLRMTIMSFAGSIFMFVLTMALLEFGIYAKISLRKYLKGCTYGILLGLLIGSILVFVLEISLLIFLECIAALFIFLSAYRLIRGLNANI